jgi:hypothetical protein
MAVPRVDVFIEDDFADFEMIPQMGRLTQISEISQKSA